jgi:hypothetical protein
MGAAGVTVAASWVDAALLVDGALRTARQAAFMAAERSTAAEGFTVVERSTVEGASTEVVGMAVADTGNRSR